MNRELKLWAPEESASPSKSGNVMWECIQTVEFTSSAAGDDMETAFFNQVVVAPGANLIVVANAKKNAIYVVHVQFGGRGGRAQMKYLAEFSVTIPILSLMVREQRGSEGGQGAVVQIYCVQTLAIQQYSLLVSQCVPMSTEKSARQATGVVDKAAVKVVTSTAGSGGGGGGAEKAGTKGDVAGTGGDGAGSGAPNVPPGYGRITVALENLMEGGQARTEMAKMIASTKLSAAGIAQTLAEDDGKAGGEMGTEKGTQGRGGGGEKGGKQDAVAVAPVRILARSRSPTKNVEQQRYGAGLGGVAKSGGEDAEEVRFSPGGLRRQASGTAEDSSNARVGGGRSGGMGRQGSGGMEKASEYRESASGGAGMRRTQGESREEGGSNEGATQSGSSAVGSGSPFSSMESGVQSAAEEEAEQRGMFGMQGGGVRGNVLGQHLITPKEVMSLVGGSRAAQVGAGNREAGGGGGGGGAVGRGGVEVEPVQLETVNFSMAGGGHGDGGRESDASKGVQESELESSEQEMASLGDGGAGSEFGSAEYGQSEFSPTEEEGLLEAGGYEGLDVGGGRGSGGGETGASSAASAASKQRKSKNKTSGGTVSGGSALLAAPLSLSPAMAGENEATSWSSGVSEAGLAAEVAMMQESLNQVRGEGAGEGVGGLGCCGEAGAGGARWEGKWREGLCVGGWCMVGKSGGGMDCVSRKWRVQDIDMRGVAGNGFSW